MRITSVEAIPFRIPLRRKVSFATGQLTALEHVLVRVRSADGVVGTAEAPARPMVYGESTSSITHAVREWFAPLLMGLDAHDVESRRTRLSKIEQNATAKGAVDIACHDLVARSVGLPLRYLLGGGADEVEVSHILGLGSVEEVADEAIRIREQHGIATFKLKAGIDAKRDTALIDGVRAKLGDEIRITVDCNHGYDLETAIATVPRWEDAGVAWVEEPCPGPDRETRGHVARATRLPLMADESATDIPQVVEEIRRGHCRFISIKTARGGYARSSRIVALCEAFGLATVIGSQGDTDLGSLTSAQFQAANRATAHYPGELSFYLEAEAGILKNPPKIEGGKLRLPQTPGHGGELDEEALTRFRTDR
ncbi:L-alanine-DL-glutamate epimerase-like enolase superfamily enzyme [Rhodoligotrophos appendicifer]|uniref:mandelate racemase/muconate lactonizing enzyme family protein n=1 Tax=Rhodoligotrophos appendicifer TaxID=987056 RepID=UPI001186F474|nr:enolase C-terminal domain-like protein [Rhodoligotrophos appendicifer]